MNSFLVEILLQLVEQIVEVSGELFAKGRKRDSGSVGDRRLYHGRYEPFVIAAIVVCHSIFEIWRCIGE